MTENVKLLLYNLVSQMSKSPPEVIFYLISRGLHVKVY